MPTNDARFGLPKPITTDAVAQHRLSITAVIDFLRDSGVVGARGTLAARPAPDAAHTAKRFYVVSDQGNRVDLDIGSAWVTVGGVADGSITAAKLDSASVIEAKYAPNSIPAAAFKDATVGFAELVSALKPSEGASGASEALRAIGAGAGQVAAGNDSRFPAGVDIGNADIATAAAIAESKLALASDAAAATPSRRSLGPGAAQAAAGNDARLSNQRAPQGPEANLKIIRGIVNANGTVPSGAGFTVNKVGTGNFIITFTTAFSNLPAVTLAVRDEAFGSSSNVVLRYLPTNGSFEVNTVNSAGSVNADLGFTFIAIGPA